MSFGEVANSINSATFGVTLLSLNFTLNHTPRAYLSSSFLAAYSARAPPKKS